jgi:hypothetical protein
MTPAKKKRKTAAGAVPVGTRRTTRSQRPGLSLEMIGKVASFASYDGGDVMNICKAVGRKNSAVIRYTCLRKNYRYLQHVLEQNVREETEDTRSSNNAKTGADIRAWMAINTDWKDDPVVGRATRESSEGVTSTVVVRENENREYNFSARAIFHNPAVAIQFGLDDVLKNLVETAGIEVNACKWNSYTYAEPFHLLIHAVKQKDLACLEYLLSTEKVDMISPIFSDGSHTNPNLKMFILAYDFMPKEHFQAIVRRPSFGVNEPMDVAGRSLLPLHYTCISAGTGRAPMSPNHMELIQILLDEGADPMLQTGDNLSTIAFATLAASEENVEDSSEVKAGWREIVRMMEEKIRRG